MPGVIGKDDRVVIDTGVAPWTAVGQVNISGYRRRISCTGTLIAPNLVVTAAHCVVSKRTGKVWPSRQIHFLAGVGKNGYLGSSKAACVRIAEGFKGTKGYTRNKNLPIKSIVNDVAVIVLKDEISLSPAEIVGAKQVESGAALIYAGYQRDRRHRLLVDKTCKLKTKRQGLWYTDCDALKAGSGGPVFVRRDSGLQMGAVLVAVQTKKYSIAIPINKFSWLIRAVSGKQAGAGPICN